MPSEVPLRVSVWEGGSEKRGSIKLSWKFLWDNLKELLNQKHH